jgi:hypothetical protein
MIIIEKAFYSNYRDNFFVRVSIKGKTEPLYVDYEYGMFYLGRISASFYTEEETRKITKKLQIALFCEQFIPGSKYKTEPGFEIDDVDSFKELAEILDMAENTKIRTVTFGENIVW